jgi:hypothetical protein
MKMTNAVSHAPVAFRPSAIRPVPSAMQVSQVSSDAVAQFTQDNTALRSACTSMITQALTAAQNALAQQTKAYQKLSQDMMQQYKQLQTNCGSTMQNVQKVMEQQLKSEENVAGIVANANKLIKQTNKALDWMQTHGNELQDKLVNSFEQIQREIDAIMKQHHTHNQPAQ